MSHVFIQLLVWCWLASRSELGAACSILNAPETRVCAFNVTAAAFDWPGANVVTVITLTRQFKAIHHSFLSCSAPPFALLHLSQLNVFTHSAALQEGLSLKNKSDV